MLKYKSKAFFQIEKHSGEKLPTCLKAILIASGFSSMASLQRISEADFLAIEEHMKGNRELVGRFDCCNKEQYHKQQVFKLLPGHRAIIKGIPGQIESLKQSGVIEKPRKSNPAPDENLIGRLILNLENYIIKLGVPHENLLSRENIIRFERQPDENEAKCLFLCCFCEKIIPVKYKGYWMSSNATSHLKKHVEETEGGEETDE